MSIVAVTTFDVPCLPRSLPGHYLDTPPIPDTGGRYSDGVFCDLPATF